MASWKKKNKYQGTRVHGTHCVICGRRKSTTTAGYANPLCATCVRRAKNA